MAAAPQDVENFLRRELQRLGSSVGISGAVIINGATAQHNPNTVSVYVGFTLLIMGVALIMLSFVVDRFPRTAHVVYEVFNHILAGKIGYP